ncbi:MAG: tetratricopeptide repeat protein [Planctomycetes bacterium]|nr:tetratricopeptide repeat protein [Planctomycetota bacterium]
MRKFVLNPRRFLATIRWMGCLGLLSMLSGCCCTSGWMNNNWGMCQYQKGNYSQARGDFQRAVINSPRNPDYRHNLAMAMQKQGDTVGAEQVFRHNLSVDPMHQPTYHALSQMLISQQRTAEAEHLLTGWRESQPYVPEAYIEQAWFQRETGNRVAAEQTLRQALQVKPNHPTALAQLGQLYHESGQVDQASSYYQRSLISKWNQPEVQSRMATLTDSGARRSLRRSAMLQNDAGVSMLAMNAQPVGGQPMLAQYGAVSMVDSVAVNDPTGRSRRVRRHNHGSAEQMTAYPVPNFVDGDAGLMAAGVSAAPTAMTMSPTVMPEMAAQTTIADPTVASFPTPIPQADPAHATEMTASLPVVEPY